MFNLKLIAMKQKASVQLYSYSYHTDWYCTVESKDQELMFKINTEGHTPSEAIDLAYERWLKLTGAVPEFIGALPPPAPEEYQDAEHMVVIDDEVDDDIPF